MVQSQEVQGLTIARLAAAGGVGVETIRYYQRKGLLETPTHESDIRRYGSDDLRRLRFIRQGQAAGIAGRTYRRRFAPEKRQCENDLVIYVPVVARRS